MKPILVYVIAAICFIVFKLGFRVADNDALQFLLWPTDSLFSLMTGSHSIYFAETGFYHPSLHVIVDKSCSGFNFWMLSFVLFAHLLAKSQLSKRKMLLLVPVALIVAYVFTIFVNASRISVAVALHNHEVGWFTVAPGTLHEAVGIVINLSFLVLAYYLLQKINNHQSTYAEPA